MELPDKEITRRHDGNAVFSASGSGIMAHITGIILFTEEGLVRRFSRTVFLEPCRKTGDALYVRNDIVHYSEFDAMPQPGGMPMQPGMQPVQPGMQPAGMYVCPQPR